jgi:hypothetical protein
MEKRVIKLTESELNQIIEESVRSIIAENMEDEGLWDTMKSFGGQYAQRGKEKAQEMGQGFGQKMKGAYNSMTNGVKNAGKKMKGTYNAVANDVKSTYRNAQQDGQMKSMIKSFNDFKIAVEKFKANGGKVDKQLGSRIKGIENMMNAYPSHYQTQGNINQPQSQPQVQSNQVQQYQ